MNVEMLEWMSARDPLDVDEYLMTVITSFRT